MKILRQVPDFDMEILWPPGLILCAVDDLAVPLSGANDDADFTVQEPLDLWGVWNAQ